MQKSISRKKYPEPTLQDADLFWSSYKDLGRFLLQFAQNSSVWEK